MNYGEMLLAVQDAKQTVKFGDTAARNVSILLVNRLRLVNVPTHVLVALKKELRDFNINTRQWKDRA